MLIAMILAALAPSGDEIILLEEAEVAGRYVRLVDLVDGGRLDETTRSRIAPVYLGRSPEEGSSRTISAVEIRRELERRGMDPEGFTFVGEQVTVTRTGIRVRSSAMRDAIALEIKQYLLERSPELRPADLKVRITAVRGLDLPGSYRVTGLAPAASAAGKDVEDETSVHPREYTATLLGEDGKTPRTVRVVTRILQARNVVFATREISPYRKIRREDVEVRRIETETDSDVVGDVDSLVGGRANVRIHRGAAIRRADVRLQPVIRAGDVVRVFGKGFETDARAISAGGIGEAVTMEFLSTRNRFGATVVNAGSVRATGGGK